MRGGSFARRRYDRHSWRRDAGANSASRVRAVVPPGRAAAVGGARARAPPVHARRDPRPARRPAAGGRAGPERRGQPGRGRARAAVRGRRRDPGRAHQAARDDVVAPGRDRVPGRQVRARRRRRPARHRAARGARGDRARPGRRSRSWRASTASAPSRPRFTITPFVGFLGRPPGAHAEPGARSCACSRSRSRTCSIPTSYREERWDTRHRRLRRALLRPRRRDGVGRDRAHPHQLPRPSRRRSLTAADRSSRACDLERRASGPRAGRRRETSAACCRASATRARDVSAAESA